MCVNYVNSTLNSCILHFSIRFAYDRNACIINRPLNAIVNAKWMFSLCQIFKGPLKIFKHKIYNGIKIYLYRSVITRQSINCHQASISYHIDLYTVESLKFVMALFSWYSWVVLTYEFASSTKIIFNRFIFPTGTENRRIHEFTSPRISKNTQSTKTGP